jgi:tripartite ATP-independent transporter DctM subunit
MTAAFRGWGRVAGRAEDLFLTLALAAMMVLPLLEVALRKLLHTGISGQTSLVQHLVLLAGMIGGAVGARQRRLLTLGSVDVFITRPAWRTAARILSSAVGAAVSAFLFLASVQFVQTERSGGGLLAYDVPVWIVQLVLPLGFALITLRVLRNASDELRWRGVTAILAAVLVVLVLWPPVAPSALVVPAFVLLLLATVLGAPIFTALGGAGLILFWGEGSPIGSLTVDHYGLVTNPTLPTVPLFTLAGYFLAEGGASRRLIRLFQAAVGQFRGGPAILVALVCAFFTSFTGASGVTILALGGLLMPVLLNAGYSEKTSLGLLTGTGSLGLLFPPCLPLIFYAVIANVDMRDMFLGGMLPGVLLVGMTAAWGISQAPPIAAARRGTDWREMRLALWDAKWELLIPVVAFVGLFSGLATPVEAAALTAFYAFVVETLVYRDLKPLRDAPRVMTEAGVLVGGVLLILGVALGFTNYLAFAEIPAHAVDWVTATIHSKWVFLLLLNLFLIVVGALMDIYSAIVIVVPLIVPVGQAFGINPIHLGIVFLANAELGYLMPPVGENLFLASLRFNKPVSEVFRAVIPMVIVFLIAVLLITYIPAMTTTLPRWFAR